MPKSDQRMKKPHTPVNSSSVVMTRCKILNASVVGPNKASVTHAKENSPQYIPGCSPTLRIPLVTIVACFLTLHLRL